MQSDPLASGLEDAASPPVSGVAPVPAARPRRTNWRRRDTLPLWAQLGVIVLLLCVCGVLMGQLFSTHRTLDSARADAANGHQRIDALNSEVSDAQNQATVASHSADGAQSLAAAAGKSAEAGASAALAAQAAVLQSQQAALTQQQQQVNAQLGAINATKFSDGLFQVGRDIQPGTYHTEGTSDCYWARLRSSVVNDVSDNDNATGPVTLVINAGYFQSHHCGNWFKIG